MFSVWWHHPGLNELLVIELYESGATVATVPAPHSTSETLAWARFVWMRSVTDASVSCASHSLGKRRCCLLPCCSPIYFYCLITILMPSNLYFCCSSDFYTIIRAGRWFECVAWESFGAAGGRVSQVSGLSEHLRIKEHFIKTGKCCNEMKM